MTRYRINPGKYRQPITIQKRQFTQDSYGGTTEDWIDVYHIRAGIFPLSGSEFFKADQINAQITHRIQMRFLSGVTPDMRILYNNRVFQITSVIDFQERHIELQMYAKEIVT
jgi:SPP1 family predicted phage head-tail adaptor